MSGLLDEVLAAHGGLERWQAVTALTAHGTFGGLLRSRFPGNRMANVTVRVQLAGQPPCGHSHALPTTDLLRGLCRPIRRHDYVAQPGCKTPDQAACDSEASEEAGGSGLSVLGEVGMLALV